jgi:hypothetical protein
MAILRKIGMQFKKPTGFPGKIVSILMSKGNRPAYERMIKDLTINSNDKILEIGFGPGIGIHLISKRFETTDIYGIDFSELIYRRATMKSLLKTTEFICYLVILLKLKSVPAVLIKYFV